MSIKPVDFQVMLPKTAEVSKIHSDEQMRNQVLQQQQADAMQNKANISLKQVHSQDKAQEAKIREKQEKEQQKKENQKKREGESNNNSNKKDFAPRRKESIIDIRL